METLGRWVAGWVLDTLCSAPHSNVVKTHGVGLSGS